MDNIQKFRKLTPREEQFCQKYTFYLSGTKAAIEAGYSAKTADSKGSQLLCKPHIRERIQYLQDNIAEAMQLSKRMVLEEHKKLAFSNMTDLYDDWMTLKDFNAIPEEKKACIKSISTKVLKQETPTGEFIDVEWVKVELHDKQKSLEMINKMLGYDEPIKQQVEHTGLNIQFVNHGRED